MTVTSSILPYELIFMGIIHDQRVMFKGIVFIITF